MKGRLSRITDALQDVAAELVEIRRSGVALRATDTLGVREDRDRAGGPRPSDADHDKERWPNSAHEARGHFGDIQFSRKVAAPATAPAEDGRTRSVARPAQERYRGNHGAPNRRTTLLAKTRAPSSYDSVASQISMESTIPAGIRLR